MNRRNELIPGTISIVLVVGAALVASGCGAKIDNSGGSGSGGTGGGGGTSPTANEWTWMGGSNTLPQGGGLPGVYGTPGVAAAGNTPGSRQSAATWTDSQGNLWLFGGGGIDSNSHYGFLNDLWKLSTSSVQWTWVGGSSAIPSGTPTSGPSPGQPGMYGTPGVFAAGTVPG
jgi:hypothetical protein